MTKFITEESFWTLFPEAEISVVVLENLKNTDAVYTEHPELKEELQKASQKALQLLVNMLNLTMDSKECVALSHSRTSLFAVDD